MAYNNYFPASYQPGYYGSQYGQMNPYQMQQMNQQAMMQQQNQQAQQPAIQQSGFVLVQSEQEALAYPVAPGNSITFKDERRPYCYVKTMGFNQLDRPVFERYRLVKEELAEARESRETQETDNSKEMSAYATKSDLGAIWSELNAVKERIEAQMEKKTGKPKKKEEGDE